MAESKKSTKDFEFRVTGVSEVAGSDRFIVNFAHVIEGANLVGPGGTYAAGTITNNVSLNLGLDEASDYFPGQVYKVTFTPAD